jgi:hypothetical protein
VAPAAETKRGIIPHLKENDMLLALILWLGPPAIIFCIVMAIRETRYRRTESVPPWLISNISKMNTSDRKWGLK